MDQLKRKGYSFTNPWQKKKKNNLNHKTRRLEKILIYKVNRTVNPVFWIFANLVRVKNTKKKLQNCLREKKIFANPVHVQKTKNVAKLFA
jgi:hypothetical protein